MTGIAASWTMRKTKRSWSLLAAHPFPRLAYGWNATIEYPIMCYYNDIIIGTADVSKLFCLKVYLNKMFIGS